MAKSEKYMTRKEMYMRARNEDGMTNEQIAEAYGVKVSTVDRAIGKKKENANMSEYNDETMDMNEEVMSEEKTEKKVLKTIVVNCCDCGKTFSITPAEQKFYASKGYELPKRCHTCRKKRSQFEEFECVDCGATFTIKKTEREFYERNGLHLPHRCPECRKIKRERNAELAAEQNEDDLGMW